MRSSNGRSLYDQQIFIRCVHVSIQVPLYLLHIPITPTKLRLKDIIVSTPVDSILYTLLFALLIPKLMLRYQS